MLLTIDSKLYRGAQSAPRVKSEARLVTHVMKQKINAFHQNEELHWVADLACGHSQHVRHDPPWQSRPWTRTRRGPGSKDRPDSRLQKM